MEGKYFGVSPPHISPSPISHHSAATMSDERKETKEERRARRAAKKAVS